MSADLEPNPDYGGPERRAPVEARLAPPDRRWIQAAALIVLGMSLILGVAGVRIGQKADANSGKIADGQRNLRFALLGSCGRVNRLRRADNRSSARDYLGYALAADMLEGAAAAEFRRLANTAEWIPDTDCPRAVGSAAQFRAPRERLIRDLAPGERELLLKYGTPTRPPLAERRRAP